MTRRQEKGDYARFLESLSELPKCTYPGWETCGSKAGERACPLCNASLTPGVEDIPLVSICRQWDMIIVREVSVREG